MAYFFPDSATFKKIGFGIHLAVGEKTTDDAMAMMTFDWSLVLDPAGDSPVEFAPARLVRGEWVPPAAGNGDDEEEEEEAGGGTRFSIDAIKKMMTAGELTVGFKVVRHPRGEKCKDLP